MSKLLFGLFLTSLMLTLVIRNSYAEDFRQTVITDPSISRRCSALIKQRNQKIDHKQKIRGLVERSKRLIKLTPPERKSLLVKLRKNYKSLTNELRHTLNQIQNKEESIIRKGCPGIIL
ncbi:MAG: hypothetical protein K9K67_08760 [Bacteriovoracaceae bacterium]|nr:hypothetical protein [Bacteriovoracaceae bacterium]